jgi:inhibitor of cysteine peptidase
MNRKLLVLALVLPLALLAADQPAQFNADSDGKTAVFKVGDRFDLTLPENATTGYAWEVVEGLGRAVRQLGEPEVRSNGSDDKRVGVGGTVTYHFKAVGAGTATLKLVYHRRWEKDKPPLKTFQLTVTVSS